MQLRVYNTAFLRFRHVRVNKSKQIQIVGVAVFGSCRVNAFYRDGVCLRKLYVFCCVHLVLRAVLFFCLFNKARTNEEQEKKLVANILLKPNPLQRVLHTVSN